MFEVPCPRCQEKFTGDRISEVMAAKRHHMELRHLEAKIESDTSGR